MNYTDSIATRDQLQELHVERALDFLVPAKINGVKKNVPTIAIRKRHTCN